MTRRENEPPEDNYPDGVLMIFAGRDPGRTKKALMAARGLMVDQIQRSDIYTPGEMVDDVLLIEELIRQLDG